MLNPLKRWEPGGCRRGVVGASILPMIHCEHLSKRFRVYQKDPGILGSLKSFVHRPYTTVSAVEDFSFEIQPGELVGLLGPNGAGKTTLMKMLSGLIMPTAGSLQVLGYEPFMRAKDFRRQISLVMGQKSQLWWDIPALDSLELLRAYYEVPRVGFEARIRELSEALGVAGVLRTHVRKLSLGERMKMELMASLLHNPKVLFLDEPTIGLDVVAQVAIRDFLLLFHRTHGTTIILTSHYMADVEALCDRIILILGGRKRFDGPIARFQGLLGSEKTLSLRFKEAVPGHDLYFDPFDPTWSDDRTRVELRVPAEGITEIMRHLLSHYTLVEFGTEHTPIERVMHSILANPELLGAQP